MALRPVFDLRDILKSIDRLGSIIPGLQLDAASKGKLGNSINELKARVLELIPSVQKAEDHQAPEFWRKNLDYGERKQANIKGDTTTGCPFGLSIPRGCKTVGSAIHKMTPLDQATDKNKCAAANKVVFFYCKENKTCPFADKILDDKFNKVDCDFGDTGQGQKSPSLTGSPLYVGTFNSIGLNGLYNKPLGWYGDNTQARNLFFGLFSYLGQATNEFKKVADNNIDLISKYIRKLWR